MSQQAHGVSVPGPPGSAGSARARETWYLFTFVIEQVREKINKGPVVPLGT